MECANENLRADFERWSQVKSRDLKKILEDMADLHIAMYEEVNKLNSICVWFKLKFSCYFIVHFCMGKCSSGYPQVNNLSVKLLPRFPTYIIYSLL